MLTINLDDFTFELKEGTLKHVGASDKSATVKLYDIEDVDVREFGDQRKIACRDDGGNELELALDPDTAAEIAAEIERLAEESATE